MSGALSAMLYWLVRRFILRATAPLKAGLRALPHFYGATIAVNVLSVVHDGPKRKATYNDIFSYIFLITLHCFVLLFYRYRTQLSGVSQ